MSLFDTITHRRNIYKAIYALDSYICERNLLSVEDLKCYYQLKDKFDFDGTIKDVIEKCQKKLEKILNEENDDFFTVSVYYKIKKLKDENGKQLVTYRPLHTASLIDQICMAALLIPLMFDDSKGVRNKSELSRMIPHNFFGNMPSESVDSLFMNWTEKYRQYSKIIQDKSREYLKTREYDTVINFDLADFFPSIDQARMYNFILNLLVPKYPDKDDLKTLKKAIVKLLYFKIQEDSLRGWMDVYYPNTDTTSFKEVFMNRGIAQGLPQSYFFGNLCMIDIAGKMASTEELKQADAYFYVDDSVIFAKEIDQRNFETLITKLNNIIKESPAKCDNQPELSQVYLDFQKKIDYQIKFHEDKKSTICTIEEAFNGMEGLFLVQRPVSMGGWIYGNIDEVDEHVSLKKLNALQTVVENQLLKVKEEQEKDPNKKQWGETRIKWLSRYLKYFIYRQRRLKLIINGQFDESMKAEFYDHFHITTLGMETNENRDKAVKEIFNKFEEEIFQAEIGMFAKAMTFDDLKEFCHNIQSFDKILASYNCPNERNFKALYYYKTTELLEQTHFLQQTDSYASLKQLLLLTLPFQNIEVFLDAIYQNRTVNEKGFWGKQTFLSGDKEERKKEEKNEYWIELPDWVDFIFNNSSEFKRKILNCCFSLACRIRVEDSLTILHTDLKPVKYYELRILSILRNRKCNCEDFFHFLQHLDYKDVNEKMEIDVGILEALTIFRQRVQDPMKIDRLIQTHRLVKSLWHNGSKFLNAYTLHNHEHAINLIKNVVRMVNNIDFLNIKSTDYFLLFQACYLHDISMVIHPNIASFNESNPDSEVLISQWMDEMLKIENDVTRTFKEGHFSLAEIFQLRKKIGRLQVEAFQKVFNFFENKVRSTHPQDSAKYIRSWQKGILSHLSEVEADTIAKVSESHGWDSIHVYSLKSEAKEELVSIKYMMILIRMADLLDLANDRIDYYLLKQNRSQMSLLSRFHWISHLISDGYKLDVEFNPIKGVPLDEHPIEENIYVDIFLNTEIMAAMAVNEEPCLNIRATKGLCNSSSNPLKKEGTQQECIQYELFKDNRRCNSDLVRIDGTGKKCPFLCIWIQKKHEWLFAELAELKYYLNSVNSNLIKSDIKVRFFYSNLQPFDSEFYDDIRSYLQKS